MLMVMSNSHCHDADAALLITEMLTEAFTQNSKHENQHQYANIQLNCSLSFMKCLYSVYTPKYLQICIKRLS